MGALGNFQNGLFQSRNSDLMQSMPLINTGETTSLAHLAWLKNCPAQLWREI